MNVTKILLTAVLPLLTAAAWAEGDTLRYEIELSGNASDGKYAPLWFTANRYGLSSERPNSGYTRAGVEYGRDLGRRWRIDAGLDLAAGIGQNAPFIVQQAYADVTWSVLTLSMGSKERGSFPLEKDMRLSAGTMVEGPNARPVPQVRLEMKRYWDLPLTRGWLAVKGHIGYGVLTDGRWRKNFTAVGNSYTKNAVYHTKSLMLRISGSG